MSKLVTIKHNDFWYVIHEQEFISDWLPNIPKELKLNALRRGKNYKRTEQAYERKGTGKHEKY